MQLFEKKTRKPGINVTSLIDILFILIIFFVVSSKIIGESGVGLVLPNSKQGTPTSLTLPVLSVDAEQQLRLNDILLSSEELPQALQKVIKTTSSQTLILNIDKRVAHGQVIHVMDQAKSAGFHKIIFGTQTSQK